MTIRAFLVIDDGDKFNENVDFDVKPEVGEVLHWMAAGQSGQAKVTRLEHRQGPNGFFLTIIAENDAGVDGWIASMIG